MRKLNFLLGLGVISLVLSFNSCSKDENAIGPLLTITSTVDSVFANTTATISWRADAGDKNLSTFTIKEGNTPIVDEDAVDWNAFDIPNAQNETFIGSATVLIGTTATTFTLIVTDKDGIKAEQSVTINIKVPKTNETPLSAETSATWQRVGGTPGTGLALFGLKWTSNTSTSAQITKDGADKLVKLDNDAWTDIETQEVLATAVNAGNDLSVYSGISVTANKSDYTDILATKYNSGYFMIKVVSSTVSIDGAGTTITVQVKYKE